MKVSHFKNLLDGLDGIKSYYRKVPKGTQLPFLVWYVNDTQNFDADNIVWSQQANIYVDLYTQTKDFALEEALEKIFSDNQLVWDSSEATIGTEATIVNTYEVWTPIEKT